MIVYSQLSVLLVRCTWWTLSPRQFVSSVLCRSTSRSQQVCPVYIALNRRLLSLLGHDLLMRASFQKVFIRNLHISIQTHFKF